VAPGRRVEGCAGFGIYWALPADMGACRSHASGFETRVHHAFILCVNSSRALATQKSCAIGIPVFLSRLSSHTNAPMRLILRDTPLPFSSAGERESVGDRDDQKTVGDEIERCVTSRLRHIVRG
jgi:hypothetical protein